MKPIDSIIKKFRKQAAEARKDGFCEECIPKVIHLIDGNLCEKCGSLLEKL